MEDNPGFFDLVGNVRAMRRLKPNPVPRELLERVLEAGVQAPSGQNTQPWSFLVLQGTEEKAWFAERYREAIETRSGGRINPAPADDSRLARQMRAMRYQIDHMHEFPVLLVICGKRDWPFRVPPEERVGLAPPNYGAVYPCVQNILLACRAVGLGAALTTMHQMFESDMCERFGIPESYGIVVTMPIGYPIGHFGPVRRKPATGVTYYDAWGS
jgi:nitroreductase